VVCDVRPVVIVDVRIGSPTFGRWVAVQLDTARRGVFISEGLGHAFMATSAEATVVYLCSEPYSPASERAVNPLDPAIAIEWPPNGLVMLSDKDRKAPCSLRRTTGLPSYPAWSM
jgi:dTDP-4-dehydrorhamnose 3,5-epimerase